MAAKTESLRVNPSTPAASEQPNSPDSIFRTAQDDSTPTASGSAEAPKERKLMTVVFSHNRAAYYVAQLAGTKKIWLETAAHLGNAPYLTAQAGFLGAVQGQAGWRRAYDLNWSSLWAESRETRAEDDPLIVDYAAAELVKEGQTAA
jgi:hypothetical protein